MNCPQQHPLTLALCYFATGLWQAPLEIVQQDCEADHNREQRIHEGSHLVLEQGVGDWYVMNIRNFGRALNFQWTLS